MPPEATRARAVARANIALAKYWGKSDLEYNVPAVPSISLTLDALATETEVSFDPTLDEDRFTLDGLVASPTQRARVTSLLDRVRDAAGIDSKATVDSTNRFPTAAGLASSASGFAALAAAASRAAGLSLGDDESQRACPAIERLGGSFGLRGLRRAGGWTARRQRTCRHPARVEGTLGRAARRGTHHRRAEVGQLDRSDGTLSEDIPVLPGVGGGGARVVFDHPSRDPGPRPRFTRGGDGTEHARVSLLCHHGAPEYPLLGTGNARGAPNRGRASEAQACRFGAPWTRDPTSKPCANRETVTRCVPHSRGHRG